MLHKASSFTSFKKIISNSTAITLTQHKPDPLSQGELMLESRIEEQPLQLGLQSEKSKLQTQGVRSSIDSTHRKKESSSSIPLSELILRDNGYDYLFISKDQLMQKSLSNLKQLYMQTQEMIDYVRFQLLLLEQTQIKSRVLEIEKEIAKIRATRKSRSPIQQNSQYLYEMGRKRKERLSGRLLQIHVKQNRSNMKTQCDSKPPSLPSAPVTPINQNKLMLSPNKKYKSQYLEVIRAKKTLLKQSINTISAYNSQRITQIKQENNIIRQQLLLLNSQIHFTPVKKTHLLMSQRNFDTLRTSPSTKNASCRRFMGMRSPQTHRDTKKALTTKLISDMRNETRLNARQEYFLSSR